MIGSDSSPLCACSHAVFYFQEKHSPKIFCCQLMIMQILSALNRPDSNNAKIMALAMNIVGNAYPFQEQYPHAIYSLEQRAANVPLK